MVHPSMPSLSFIAHLRCCCCSPLPSYHLLLGKRSPCCKINHLPPQSASAHHQRHSSTHAFPSNCTSSTCESRVRMERLWQEYFADPSRWWDNRKDKINPNAPDFRHKSTKHPLWIDNWYNPTWIKDMLEKKDTENERSPGVYGSQTSDLQVRALNWQQQQRDGCDKETLSLEEAIGTLLWTPELPSVDDFVFIVQQCRKRRNLAYATLVHAHICNNGLETHRAVGNYIVPMFVECGNLPEAGQVFNRLVFRNEHSWTSLILGFIQCGRSLYAVSLYQKMQEDSVHPSRHTLTALLKACARLKDVDRGRETHFQIIQRGFDWDLFLGNALIDMYAKCGALSEAKQVFDKLSVRDVVSWNALIAGYCEHGLSQEVLKCFAQMQLDGVCPDTVTFVCILKAYGNVGAIDKGRELHAKIMQMGFTRDLFVGSTLVDMYAKCGSLSEAQEVFDKLQVRDVVAWTALIAGYVEHGSGQDALRCFEQMQLEGIPPDAITFICALKACGSTGAIDKGREIHAEISQKRLEREPSVASALIEMYAKYGSLSEARKVFYMLPGRNVVLWSAMINGYGMNLEGNMAVQCFEDMKEQGVTPDGITFTCLLTACSHARLVFKGKEYFKMMKEHYGIIPTTDHYTCVVDLVARSGDLYEAMKFLETLPCPPSMETWTALLSACKTYGEAEVGWMCFQQLVQMDPQYAGSYVLMTSIYANAGKKDAAYRIEEMRKQAGVKKKPGSALIEVNKKLHEFIVGKNENKEISAMLEILSSSMEDHVPNLDLVLRPVSDKEKEVALCEHAEKLAVAFGLLNTPRGQILRVTKNMRMCSNCHNANKAISTIEQREIIVRDSYCVHRFKDGVCSCGDAF